MDLQKSQSTFNPGQAQPNLYPNLNPYPQDSPQNVNSPQNDPAPQPSAHLYDPHIQMNPQYPQNNQQNLSISVYPSAPSFATPEALPYPTPAVTYPSPAVTYPTPAVTYPYGQPQEPSMPDHGVMPTFPPIQPAPPDTGCGGRIRKNQPQSNSVAAAFMVFMSGGLNIAFSLGFRDTRHFTSDHIRICWFLGAMIGAVVSSILFNRMKTKIIMIMASILVILGAILCLSAATNSDVVTAARYLDGIGNGLIFVPSIILAGEQSIITRRGMVTANMEYLSFSMGIYLQMIYCSYWPSQWTRGFNLTHTQGVISLVLGVMALVFAFFLNIESPIYFLLRNEEYEAIESLRRLQLPNVTTNETYEQFEEHKRYIAEARHLSFTQKCGNSLTPLLKICLHRTVNAMTFSRITAFAFIVSNALGNRSGTGWPFIVLGLLRIFGGALNVNLMDLLGRKGLVLVGCIVCGGLSIGVGVIFSSLTTLFFNSNFMTAVCLIVVMQFFAPFLAASSSPYISEAFPLGLKQYFIAISFCIEMLIHLIICVAEVKLRVYFFTSAALFFSFGIFTYFCMPETRKTTLLDAQLKFRPLMSQGF